MGKYIIRWEKGKHTGSAVGRRYMIEKRKVKLCIKNSMGKLLESEDGKIQKMIHQADVISFDIFDTMVKRNVKEPGQVHILVYEKFYRETRVKIDGYSMLRISAEEEARKYSQKEEISLEEIFLCLKGVPDNDKKRLMQIEEETEIGICCPNLRIKRIYEKALKENKHIIITSDMYLREEVIEKILKKCGYDGYEKLYLSSSYYLCKSTGSIYEVIKKDYSAYKGKILHIGDNFKSDYLSAKRRGIHVCQIDGQKENLRYWKRGKRKDFHYGEFYSFMNNHIDHTYSDAMAIGYEVLGPILLGYCAWLKEKIEKDKIDKVFFLSREGKILQEAFRTLYPNHNIPQCYLYVSRQSLIVPLIADATDFEEMVDIIKVYLHVPTLKMIRNICLLDQNEFNSALSKIGMSEDDNIHEIPNGKKKRVFSIIQDLGKKQFIQQKSYVKKYLNENNFSGNVAVVDIGWAGTMQNALQQYAEGTGAFVRGYYLGVRDMEKKEYYKNIQRYGYLFEPDRNEDFDLMARFTICIFELLFLNPTGSVQKYDLKRGKVVPVFADAEYGGSDGKLIEDIQCAALNFLQLIRKDTLSGQNVKIPAEYAMHAYSNFAVYPKLSTLRIFKDFHFANGDLRRILPEHSIFYYLFHGNDLKQEMENSVCKIFLLKKLFKMNLPYFNFLKLLAVKMNMKSAYRKRYYRK